MRAGNSYLSPVNAVPIRAHCVRCETGSSVSEHGGRPVPMEDRNLGAPAVLLAEVPRGAEATSDAPAPFQSKATPRSPGGETTWLPRWVRRRGGRTREFTVMAASVELLLSNRRRRVTHVRPLPLRGEACCGSCAIDLSSLQDAAAFAYSRPRTPLLHPITGPGSEIFIGSRPPARVSSGCASCKNCTTIKRIKPVPSSLLYSSLLGPANS